jgi:hypothetical protein
VPLQLNKKEIFRKPFWLENDFMEILYGSKSDGARRSGSVERIGLGVNSLSLRVQKMSGSIVDCTQ